MRSVVLLLSLMILCVSFTIVCTTSIGDQLRPPDPKLPGLITKYNQTDVDTHNYIIDVKDRMNYWTTMLERKAPAYVWGGVGMSGGDCSGQVYYICHMSGLPYLRSTALMMWNGAWPGKVTKSWKDAQFPNLIYFTFTANRPSGHVGLVRTNHYPNYLIFAEASSTANSFKRTIMDPATGRGKSLTGIQVLDLTVGFDTKKSIQKSK